MNFKHELSLSKPLLRSSTQSLILGVKQLKQERRGRIYFIFIIQVGKITLHFSFTYKQCVSIICMGNLGLSQICVIKQKHSTYNPILIRYLQTFTMGQKVSTFWMKRSKQLALKSRLCVTRIYMYIPSTINTFGIWCAVK